MEFGKIFSKTIDDYKKNWGRMLGVSAYLIVFGIIKLFISELSDILGIIASLLFVIITIGVNYICLKVSRSEKFCLQDLFIGFRDRTGRLVLLEFLYWFFTILWGLLLIIPGIIKGIAYSQAFFIYLDNPKLTASECIKKSQILMDGYKTDYFSLSFIFGLVCLVVYLPLMGMIALISFLSSMETIWMTIMINMLSYLFFPLNILFYTNFYLSLIGYGSSADSEQRNSESAWTSIE